MDAGGEIGRLLATGALAARENPALALADSVGPILRSDGHTLPECRVVRLKKMP